jgi:hypothetical protein
MKEKLEIETKKEKYEKPLAIDLKTAAANGDFDSVILGTCGFRNSPCTGALN